MFTQKLRVLRSSLVALLSVLFLHFVAGHTVRASDWPQWMGPEGNGVSTATEIFDEHLEPKIREVWRKPIGRGYSSISISEGQAYTMADGPDGPQVLALDGETGRDLWRFNLEASGPTGPLSTPAIDGDRVFAVDGAAHLYALSVDRGELLWSCDLVTRFGATPPAYGFSSSPLVDENRLLLLVGGEKEHNLVAFDKATGEVLWSVFYATLGSYSSPVAGILHDKHQIVVPGGDAFYAVESESGHLLWRYRGLSYPDRNPILLPDDRIFIPLTEGGFMMKLEIRRNQLHLVKMWSTSHIKESYGPAIYFGNSVYGFDDNSLTCIDARTGELRWREELNGGSMIVVDSHLLLLDAIGGLLRIISLNPTAYSERLSMRVFNDDVQSLTPPSFASGYIFLRNEEHILALKVTRNAQRAKD